MALDARQVINGSWGSVYFDDELMITLKAFQAKVEFNKEEINVVGSLATDTKITSYAGKGSMTVHKVNSYIIKKATRKLKEGKDIRCTMVGKLDDPDAKGAERIAIKNVSFDEVTLFDFEVASPGEIEAPFTFTDWELLDVI